jgi:hypothetical protein
MASPVVRHRGRSNWKLLKGFTLLLIVLIAKLASAVDVFDYHCANIALLQDRQVQNEVGITEAQRAQMNKFADAHRARLQAYQQQLKGQRPQMQVLGQYVEELKKNVIGILTAPQIKRLRELNLQAAGLVGLLDPVVAKRVGMSDPQYNKFKQTYIDGKVSAEKILRTAIEPINQKYVKLVAAYKGKEKEHPKEMQDLETKFKGESGAAAKHVQPQIDAITKATEKKLRAQITPQMNAAWIALRGKAFQPKKTK